MWFMIATKKQQSGWIKSWRAVLNKCSSQARTQHEPDTTTKQATNTTTKSIAESGWIQEYVTESDISDL